MKTNFLNVLNVVSLGITGMILVPSIPGKVVKMIRLFILSVIVSLAFVGASRAGNPPPRKAHPATRVVFWVCPLDVHYNPVTKPFGVCFRDFVGH